MTKEKWYICKDSDGVVHTTDALAQGYVLATLEELENEKWIFERFPNAIFIVKE